MSRYSFDVEELMNHLPSIMIMRWKMDSRLHALLSVLLLPFIYINKKFLSYQQDKTYRLDHNGQVYSLEKIIREHCGNRKCRITDGEYVDETMIPYHGNDVLANYQVDVPYDGDVDSQVNVMYSGFGQIAQNDFIVHLPKELYGKVDESALKAKIDEYKIAGKSYDIIYDDVIVETYGFRWMDPICVQSEIVNEIHNFRWTDPICVQAENLPLRFRWMDPICVQKENFTTSKQ